MLLLLFLPSRVVAGDALLLCRSFWVHCESKFTGALQKGTPASQRESKPKRRSIRRLPPRRSFGASLAVVTVSAVVFNKAAVALVLPKNTLSELATPTLTTATSASEKASSSSQVEASTTKTAIPPSSIQEASLEARMLMSVDVIPSEISNEATCDEWVSWVPPRTHPAIVMQVVSTPYADLQRNFIRLMELNSAFTRNHLFLICLDDTSVSVFASLGIRCVPMGALHQTSRKEVWKVRARVLSCLLAKGYDVIMSDADALWLGDPMEYIGSSNSSVIASRGNYPYAVKKVWGTTMCMGFVMFRARSAAMNTFQDTMERIVLETGDDQVALNRAAHQLGIAWDNGSDMRYQSSTDVAKGTLVKLLGDDGEPFEISLLPHNKFTRVCNATPISNETTVAHCYYGPHGVGGKKSWMQDADIWFTDSSNSPLTATKTNKP